ncbi:hypothetical protein COT99_00895 [Candidatus Falkowbacteria bacterium CG10_big_fil_rev_8_21_14_0_10_43_10]|uniref:Extradiol ring-cleavage dioxygenase class III enzyme subunit B domain-containing protein n=1 Tax=Candidatus Falkowbacteria bacterium CG10_big_fil_rev_8_21_14_0_10_43_10 TaxID=1974567 RepID=A0A2H0V2U5_9BACT|nr:MAG: hypothetical protein COT99_00895 [Candidatus Falkowbacteria bacterium CG10_big_fil_rev_8_21_14_0_10_43_10]
MLIFSAIVPHSPLLIETVGREHTKKLAATIEALKKMEGDFYAAQPETVIIISPHGQINEKSFVINFSPEFKGNFGEFGDLATKDEYAGDNALSYRIKERLETTLPLQLTTVESLDYGCLTPLHFLCAHKKNVKIVPISSSGLDLPEHYKFGRALIEEIAENTKRIAVIASAETSNKLTKDSPDGYLAGAKKFDQKIIKLLKEKQYEEIINLDPKQVVKTGTEEIKAIAILLGIIVEINCRPELLSYESPFGIGHLVMEFGV